MEAGRWTGLLEGGFPVTCPAIDVRFIPSLTSPVVLRRTLPLTIGAESRPGIPQGRDRLSRQQFPVIALGLDCLHGLVAFPNPRSRCWSNAITASLSSSGAWGVRDCWMRALDPGCASRLLVLHRLSASTTESRRAGVR